MTPTEMEFAAVMELDLMMWMSAAQQLLQEEILTIRNLHPLMWVPAMMDVQEMKLN